MCVSAPDPRAGPSGVSVGATASGHFHTRISRLPRSPSHTHSARAPPPSLGPSGALASSTNLSTEGRWNSQRDPPPGDPSTKHREGPQSRANPGYSVTRAVTGTPRNTPGGRNPFCEEGAINGGAEVVWPTRGSARSLTGASRGRPEVISCHLLPACQTPGIPDVLGAPSTGPHT